ncbi:dipeptidase PepV [Clostridium subterminale]|uniref:Dipeptidase PepV n=1 Tax=Clostridium subterminale TaxID=1550 RepID=A0ABN1KH73_CLOSU
MFKEHIDANKDHIIMDLIELVKIRSVASNKRPNMPFGEEVHKSLKYVLDKAKDMGFKIQNFCGYCGQVDAGYGDYTIGILCHVDVAEEGEGWTKSPFLGEVYDGKIYGRGIVKAKAPLIACLYAMKFLQDEALIPEGKKIRMIVGADKETGIKSINYYKEYEVAPDIGFTPDGVFPVIYGEKGIMNLDLHMEFSGGFDAPINIVQIVGGHSIDSVPSKASIILSCEDIFKEKIETELKIFSKRENIKYETLSQNKLMNIEFIGKEADSNNPDKGVNAISYGIKFLENFEEFIDRMEFVHEYNRLISTSYNGEKINCKLQDEDSGNFTLNVSTINLNSDRVDIKVNITYPISYVYSDVLELVKDGFKYSSLKINSVNHLRSVSFSKDSFVVKKLMKAYREVTGDEESQPYVSPKGTYARIISNIVSFGPILPRNKELNYEVDEFITVDEFIDLVEIYAMAIYELLK